MGYKILLLDLDDTILDFGKGERLALEETLRAAGLPFDEELARGYALINDECWRMLERGEIGKQELIVLRFKRFLDRYGLFADAAALNGEYMERMSEKAIFLPGAEDFLKKAGKRLRLFLITNGTAWVQEKRLLKAGLYGGFEGIFISERLGAKKPDVLFFERVAASIDGFSREETVVMGDSLSSDILGAENYGLDAIWFNRKGWENDGTATPAYTVSTYAEAEKILNV